MRLRADQRLFVSYLLLISVLVVSLSLGADSLLRERLMSTVQDALRRELALGTAYFELAPPELAIDSVADRLGALSGHRVTIIAPDGRVRGESDPVRGRLAELENHGTRPEVRAALAGELGVAVRRSETVGRDLLYMAMRSRRGEVVRFAVALAEIDRAMRRVQRGILGVGGLALLLAALFSLGFSVVVTRPLRRMQAVARAMAAGDLSQRLRERRADEFGDLAAALDSLADELQRRLSQLEEERVEMQTLIDSMAEGVIALHPDGAVRRANPAARRMFQLPPHPQGIAPAAVARRPEFLQLVDRALGGAAVPPTELGGDGRTLLATAHPLPDGGAVLVFLDVSELRRLEGVRRDFVANASHELKTPLTAIRGYSETLLDPDLPPELRRRFAETVKSNADRLQRIVDDLLDLSRIESGGWRARPEPLAVATAVSEAWGEHAQQAEEKGIALAVEIAPGAERVEADPGAVHQILGNLFGNALRYTPPGGRITVRTRPAAGRRRPGAWVEVEVADTGSGIPAVHLPRIFERFYRADPARSRAEGGTGLGLAIVRHLVEAHGGRIEAESTLGAGTRVRFLLPAVAPQQEGGRRAVTDS